MVDGPRAGEIVEQLQRVGSLGISCHTQLVLCPTINDGDELDRSIAELAALRPIVESISVVPVGLTKYNNMLKVEGLPALRPYTVEESRAVMERVAPWQARFAAEPDSHCLPFVCLSDEWYYVTRRPFPPARHYGAYAQIENGVGLTRKLLDDWRAAKRALHPQTIGTFGERAPRVAIVTSTMAGPVIERIARDVRAATGLGVRVVPVVNTFFGPSVTVAGLLCAQDVLDTLATRCADFTADDLLLLPRVMLDNAGARFLDDMSVEEFTGRIAARVAFAKTADELVAALKTVGTRAAQGDAVAPEAAIAGMSGM
jgi:NifB/MoaA-like Fe-S oxidoreductase